MRIRRISPGIVLTAALMVYPRQIADGQHSVFVSGNDTEAKGTVRALLESFGHTDIIDLGDRRFRVVHLPGHSPDSIGLLDEHDGLFFSGDAIYDDGTGNEDRHDEAQRRFDERFRNAGRDGGQTSGTM